MFDKIRQIEQKTNYTEKNILNNNFEKLTLKNVLYLKKKAKINK